MTNGIIIPNWDNIYNEALRQARVRGNGHYGYSDRQTFIVWDTQSRRRYVFVLEITPLDVKILAPMPLVSVAELDYPVVVEWPTSRYFRRFNHTSSEIKLACERFAIWISNLYDASMFGEWIPAFYPKPTVRKCINLYRQNCKSNGGCQYSYHNPWLD